MKKWYDIKSRATSLQATAEIFIYGDIGESWWGETVTAAEFVKEIAALDADAITVRINSYGGSVTDGIAIYNAIKRHKASVTTAIDGAAYSIASLIAMAGDRVEMAENAMLMIHAPWGGVMGNSAVMRDYADLLDKMAGAMASAYANCSGKSTDDILAMLTDGQDHWFSADEALAEGFATHITPALAIAASAAEFTQPDFWAARKATAPRVPGREVESPVAANATPTPKGKDMPEVNTQAAAHDETAIRAKMLADNAELIETGRAYAKFGGEALALQAVSEGWTVDVLKAKLLHAANSGPAHAAYGQGARAGENANPRTAGFASFGEFARAVHASAMRPQHTDIRLGGAQEGFKAAATTFGNESTGSEGGFAVPPEYSDRITSLVTGEQSILGMCDSMPTNSNRVILPTDEDAAWNASSGILVYWAGEGASMSASKPALKEIQIPLHKLYALVPVTEELLEDAPLMERFLNDKSAEKIDFAVTNAIINGTGVAKPMGILNAACLVSVAKETSQAAATIVGANILKMYGRQMNPGRSVWLCNSDTLQMLLSMNIEFKSSAGAGIAAGARFPTVTLPGENGQTFATIMGRPVVVTEACSTLGTVGDVIFADLAGGYFAPYKAGGIQSAMSMHLYFDQGLNAFRWTFRVGGQPWLSAAVTPASGSSNTKSSMVALATR